ncbi:hypothetical protein GQ607_010472 [Colletotrichum asianum]|uniref:Uncharacterized protein n=1 Tax=Colletotrichum asianum TaxID=702518 RepID=A0A8H3ZQG3_9PEZI|nr:hypothetical protein GQ607_010472 [Colletotrichum asianum]
MMRPLFPSKPSKPCRYWPQAMADGVVECWQVLSAGTPGQAMSGLDGLGWAKDGKTAVLAQWCCWNGFVGSAAGETRRRAVAIFEHQRHGSLESSSKRHHSQH